MKVALICGVTGQDGAYLARFLLNSGYKVIGTSRGSQPGDRSKLAILGIAQDVEILSMALNDFRSVLNVLAAVKPDEIYNLAGQSSVSLSFDQPVETLESIVTGTLNLLECIRFLDVNTKLYSAGSSECFGNTLASPANEDTPFRPRSPYAVAKATAANLVLNYRDAYGLKVCTGFLFNHESPLRGRHFVTRKIVSSAFNILQGTQKKLVLGNLDIARDWGWAPDYVEAMWLMLQQKDLGDFVVATGKTVSLQYFVEKVFSYFNLIWQDYVEINPGFFRPSEVSYSSANIAQVRSKLGWIAKHSVDDVINMLCESEIGDQKTLS